MGRIKQMIRIGENKKNQVIAEMALLPNELVIVWFTRDERGHMEHDLEPVIELGIERSGTSDVLASTIKSASKVWPVLQHHKLSKGNHKLKEIRRKVRRRIDLGFCYLGACLVKETEFVVHNGLVLLVSNQILPYSLVLVRRHLVELIARQVR